MKAHTQILAVMVVTTTLWGGTACKKENDNSSAAAYEKIQGRWTFTGGNLDIYNYNTGSPISLNSVSPTAGDYAEFRADGTLYTRLSGTPDTFSYVLLGNTRLIVNNGGHLDTADILVLNTSSLAVQAKSANMGASPPQRIEITANFSR